MLYWIPYAFIRIVVFFIAGILLGVFAPGILPLSWAAGLFAALILIYFLFWYINLRQQKLIINTGLVGLIAIFLSGFLTHAMNDERLHREHISHASEIVFYRGIATTPAQEKENTWKQVVEVSAVYSDAEWKIASGQVIVYFPKKFFNSPFEYGDELLIRGSPSEVRRVLNPGSFDYQKFLSYKNIYHQHFLRERDAQFVRPAVPNQLLAVSFRIREWSGSKIRSVVEGEREQAIASALVLGIVEGIDSEISNAYAATGAMHVLAVSGLHVGIIYLILGIMLKPVKRFRYGKWAAAIVTIVILWGYACVTGLPPSVLRAVMMFSFVALAQPLKHQTNIYNTLGASAFCLLLYDPLLIMSVGFQLSYLAVLGIVYLQPLLYRLYEPESRILDEIWKITSISIAAQAATFAISILYFHQFPNYFLISNLFVIPLAFVILLVGLGVLVFTFIPVISSAIGFVLEWLIRLLNYLILLMEKLPYAVTENIFITPWECVLLMAMVVLLILMIQLRSIRYFYAFAMLVVAFSFSLWRTHMTAFSSPRFTVYAINGHSAFDLIENGTAYFFADSALTNDPDQIRFHVTPNRLQSRANVSMDGKKTPMWAGFQGGSITYWNGVTILQLYDIPSKTPEISIDYLILSGNAARNAGKLLSKIKSKEIILDSSNSYFVVDKVYNSLTQKYRLHSVWHHGAFDTNL
jgi:competence protein ComEC